MALELNGTEFLFTEYFRDNFDEEIRERKKIRESSDLYRCSCILGENCDERLRFQFTEP